MSTPMRFAKGDAVPDRPVRVSFYTVFDGASAQWKLKSGEELAPGIQSKAPDRHADTPKISP
jgi:hypothetical protein